jgi:DNA replication protein DnaC
LEYQTSTNPFLNIPQKKLDDSMEEIFERYSKNGVLSNEGALMTDVFQRYFDANIPVDYWWRDMHDFVGPKRLHEVYTDVTKDMVKSYRQGSRAIFSGSHGIGKTFVSCCILKRAVETGRFSGLYLNLTDIIHVMLSGNQEDKNRAREMLLNVDYLVIDEFDARFMGSDNAADLFGRILEPIMRTRIQNRLPLFFCTNSPKIESSFSGPLQASITSLMNVIKNIPVIGGEDVRKKIKKGEI